MEKKTGIKEEVLKSLEDIAKKLNKKTPTPLAESEMMTLFLSSLLEEENL